jgi:zinc transporter ZupT
MLGFAESFLAWTASTWIPACIGLFVIVWAGRFVRSRYLAAFALGIFLWFFVDTIQGAALLDVNAGFTGGAGQVAAVALFIIGVLSVFWMDRRRGLFSAESIVRTVSVAIPLLVAGAIGIHGLGEGAAFGATAYSTSSNSLLEAFGGVSAGVAYFLHKGLEPMMAGACYCVYSNKTGSRIPGRIRDVFFLSVVFVLPSLVGAPVGYFIVGPAKGFFAAFGTTYFFALGTGTSIYAALRLSRPLYRSEELATSEDSIKIAVPIVLGFIAIYFAALFHS